MHEDPTEAGEPIAFILIVCLFFGGVFFGVTALVKNTLSENFSTTQEDEKPRELEDRWDTVHTMDLASLANASETHGSGNPGSTWAVSEVNKIRFMQRHADGSMTFDEIPAYGTHIYETAKAGAGPDDPDRPRVEIQHCRVYFTDNGALAKADHVNEPRKCDIEEPVRHRVYVPPGTVSAGMSIDPAR